MNSRHRTIVLALAVAALAALPYLAAGVGRTFIVLDDNLYVYENPQVRAGLSWGGALWASRSFVAGNWHPVTLLSHLTDVSLFGLDPWGHHLVNILLHAVAAAGLFLALARISGAPWPSAFVAALFGVHPLHVESVAWISERKDVLAAVFFMLVLLAYERYARRRRPGSYRAAVAFLALGLMAKPMLVSVPLVLLLLDYWPLGRVRRARTAGAGAGLPWGALLVEKIPFLALSAALAILTLFAQRSAGTLADASVITVPSRLANALISLVAYLGKAAWPSALAVYYPHPIAVPPWWKIAAAALVLAAVTVAAFVRPRRAPYLAVGWLWYLGMLIPVIGIVQIGEQALADRYTYLPLIGPFAMAAWGAREVCRRRRPAAVLLWILAAATLALLTAAAVRQARYWRESETLFTHTLGVTSANPTIETNYGVLLLEQGRNEEAAAHFRRALASRPGTAAAHYNLALALAGLGRNEEEIGEYRAALAIKPDLLEARYNLATALAGAGRPAEAVEHYRAFLRARPQAAEAHNDVAAALAALGRFEEAIGHYREALRIKPDYAEARRNLGIVLSRPGGGAGADPRR